MPNSAARTSLALPQPLQRPGRTVEQRLTVPSLPEHPFDILG